MYTNHLKTNHRYRAHKFLIAATIVFLAIYVPLEIWYSRKDILNPGFICDAIAFVLLAFGCWAAAYHRTRTLVPLAAAWGFCFALFWRCYFMRVAARKMDWPIYQQESPYAEPVILSAMLIAAIALICCMVLGFRPNNTNVENEST